MNLDQLTLISLAKRLFLTFAFDAMTNLTQYLTFKRLKNLSSPHFHVTIDKSSLNRRSRRDEPYPWYIEWSGLARLIS